MNFIEESFSWFDRGTQELIIHKSAINEINNAGFFSRIENNDLKDRIYNYYDEIEWRLGPKSTERRSNEVVMMYNFLRDEYGIDCRRISNLENPIQFLSDNKAVTLRLTKIKRHAGWTCTSILRVLDLAKELIASIEKEVTNN